MNNVCMLAQVVDVQNHKHTMYSCCPQCCGRVFYSCERCEELSYCCWNILLQFRRYP